MNQTPLQFVDRKKAEEIKQVALDAAGFLVEAFIDSKGVVNSSALETALAVMVSQYFKQVSKVEGKAFALEEFNKFMDFLRTSTMDCLKGQNQ